MKADFTKKKWLIVALLSWGFIWGSVPLLAQDGGESGLSTGAYVIGAKAGVNFNSFTQPGTTVGGNVGGYFRYQVMDFLQLQAEIVYSLKGGGRHQYSRSFYGVPGPNWDAGSIDGPISNVDVMNRSILIHSVEVPVTVRLGMPELANAMISPKFIIGASYSYNFAAFEQRDELFYFDNGSEFLLSNQEENVTSDYYMHNIAIHGGFAIDFNLDNGKVFTTEFRYQRGITNLNEVNLGLPITTDRLFSQTFSLNVSYSIF